MESIQKQKIIDGKYVKQKKIGEGATAKTYKVLEKSTNKVFAAKVLKEIDPLFNEEIKTLKKLKEKKKNPHIINLIDSGCGPIKEDGKEDGIPPENKQYIILEYASKGELFDYIKIPQKGFGEKYAKIIFKNILEGINLCHMQGICHRDIKISNILLDENFKPKICDFGLAAPIQGKDGSGILKIPCGTEDYAAPELFLKRNYKGVNVDVFSLGVVLMNLVTGKKGFGKATRQDDFYRLIMTKRYNQYWDELSRAIGGFDFSQDFKNLFINMVCFDPNKRYDIDYILEKDPWLKDVRNLTKEEKANLEQEIKSEFKDREKTIEKDREPEKIKVNPQNNDNNTNGNSRSVEEQEYYSSDLTLKRRKTGINMKYFVKIDGEIKPNKFMSSVINLLKMKKKCDFNFSKKSFKFIVYLEDEEKKGEDNIPKELEEELKALNLEDKNNEDDDDEGIKKVESSIRVKLYKSTNNEYIVKFDKKSGSMEDYYNNLKVIKEVIKNVLKI